MVRNLVQFGLFVKTNRVIPLMLIIQPHRVDIIVFWVDQRLGPLVLFCVDSVRTSRLDTLVPQT